MTTNTAIKEIRAALDALAKGRTDRHRLQLLLRIRSLLERVQSPVQRRVAKKRSKYERKIRSLTRPLKQLLTALDKISANHAEVCDAEVRDRMYAAVFRSFIKPEGTYAIPEDFGMHTKEGNALVRSTLQTFLTHPGVTVASAKLTSAEDRLAAFHNDGVETAQGSTCFDYFGESGGGGPFDPMGGFDSGKKRCGDKPDERGGFP
jgi:hypothetical protein